MTPVTVASNTITGVATTWQADAVWATASAFYAVLYETSTDKIRIYKSTDGTTYTEQDSSHAVTPVADASYGSFFSATNGYIYIVYQLATNSTRVRRFNTATDAWETSDFTGGNAIGGPTNAANHAFPIRLAVRSDGDVLIFYTRTAGALYYTRYEGSSWTAPAAYEASGALAASVCLGPSDLIFVGSSQDASDDQSYRTIDAANTLGTTTDLDASANTAMLYHAAIAYVADGGTDRIGAVSIDTGGEVDFYYGTSGATIGSIATINAALSATGTPYKTSVDVTAFSGKWYVCAAKTSGIVYRATDDFATPAFGTETNLVSLSSVDAMPQFIKGLGALGILYTESGTSKVEWIVAPVTSVDATGTVSVGSSTASGTTTTASAGTGVTGSVSVGTSTASGTTVSAPTEVSATGTVSAGTAATDGTTATATSGTGAAGSVSVGNSTADGQTVTATSGSAATGSVSVGTATASGTSVTAATGTSAAVAVGTSTASGTTATASTGVRASVTVGNSTADGTTVTGGTSTGTTGTVSAGTASASGATVNALAGLAATATVTAGDSTASGVLVIASVGTGASGAVGVGAVVASGWLVTAGAGVSAVITPATIVADGTVVTATGGTAIDGTLTADVQILPVLTTSLTLESVLSANVRLLSVLSYTLTIEDTLSANVTILPVVSSILELV